MLIESLGGDVMGSIPLGDIVLYLNPLHIFLFVTILVFTALIAMSRTETQVEAMFGSLDENKVAVGKKEFKHRRFLAIICGIATAGAMFNFTLFMALIGIVNIGIVSAVKQVEVLNSAYQYGLIAMMCGLPLFGGAAMILAATGTLSLFELAAIPASPMMIFGALVMLIGVCGESGIAPFFASKAEMFRTPGSPFILIIHLSSLFIIVRFVEILLTIL